MFILENKIEIKLYLNIINTMYSLNAVHFGLYFHIVYTPG